MKDSVSQYFDLQSLLRYGDLDIRLIAGNDSRLTAGEYFGRLSRFTDKAAKAAETMSEIAAQDAGESSFQTLLEIKNLIEVAGCTKFSIAMNEIINAGKINDQKTASASAKTILTDFHKFCARTVTARKKNVSSESEASDSIMNEKDAWKENIAAVYANTHRDSPLKKIIDMLDNEESTRKLRILAVDDSPVMLKSISSVLSNQYRVYTLPNPRMVKPFLYQVIPELFLLDYKMPEINGFELIPIIRSFEEHKDTPIMFLTSQGTMEHISAAISLGACDFIVKPFQGDILRERIAKYIVKKELH